MDTAIIVFGWVVWAFCFIQGMGMILSRHEDPSLGFLMKFAGYLIQIGCAATVIFSISKFHLIWWYLVAFLLTKIWLYRRTESLLIRKLKENISEISSNEEAGQNGTTFKDGE